MTGISMQMIFSPQTCSLDLLNRTLTSNRRTLANRIVGQIESSICTQTAHHNLVIGPRGSGKTHLLTYIRRRVENELGPSLTVVPLSEEERGITSLFDFLLACLRAKKVPRQAIITRVESGAQPSRVETAQELFDETTGRNSTLVIIENMSDIFSSLEERGLTQLRGFLQDRPFVSLLASSVSLFADSSKGDHAFYGFFNIHPLLRLNQSETRTYLSLLAGAKGDSELVVALKEDKAQARVNAIYDLTGGNHRLVAMLSSFLSTDGLSELVHPFVQMVDKELTPYYQQRLDRLSPYQNKIVQAIADHSGRALSVNEIAEYTFLSPQSVSRQLYDLLHGGYVRRNSVGREACYELNEPLLRLVLDVKEGRDRPLPLIVSFLRGWYEAEQLRQLQEKAPEHARSYYHLALATSEKSGISEDVSLRGAVAGVEERQSVAVQDAVEDLFAEGVAVGSEDQHLKALKKLDKVLDAKPDHADELYSRAVALHKSGREEEAIAVYDGIVERFGDSDRPELVEQVASALVNKAGCFATLGNHAGALTELDSALRLQPGNARAFRGRIDTLLNLGRDEEAFDSVVKMLEVVDNDAPERMIVAAELVSRFISDEARLRKLSAAYAEDESSLAGGIVGWLQRQLPLSKSTAERLEEAETALQSAFADLAEAAPALQILNAIRRDAMGDRKALLELPLELRRLVQPEAGEEE